MGSDNNFVTGNLFAYHVDPARIRPSGAEPTIVLVAAGAGNVVGNNHTVSNVGARSVVLDASATGTRVYDSGTAAQFRSFAPASAYSFRPTP